MRLEEGSSQTQYSKTALFQNLRRKLTLEFQPWPQTVSTHTQFYLPFVRALSGNRIRSKNDLMETRGCDVARGN